VGPSGLSLQHCSSSSKSRGGFARKQAPWDSSESVTAVTVISVGLQASLFIPSVGCPGTYPVPTVRRSSPGCKQEMPRPM